MNHNQLQAACYKYFRETYPEYRHLLFSVNNNLTNYGGNAKQRMGILLSLGVHKGVTDFILYFKGILDIKRYRKYRPHDYMLSLADGRVGCRV